MNKLVNNITYSIVPRATGFKEMNYTVETKMGMPFMDPISEDILKPIVEYITDPHIWYHTFPIILKSPSWTKLYDDVILKPIIEIVMQFNNVSRVMNAEIKRLPAETEMIPWGTKDDDPKWGVEDGKTVRFRMPLRTNTLVKYFMWDHNEFKYEYQMQVGKFYYTDMTMYHAEENLSETDAIYLQLDCEVNNSIRQAIC